MPKEIRAEVFFPAVSFAVQAQAANAFGVRGVSLRITMMKVASLPQKPLVRRLLSTSSFTLSLHRSANQIQKECKPL